MKYKVIVHDERIIEADSKDNACEIYYDTTDGTELEAFAKLIRKKSARLAKESKWKKQGK
jgi:hypothetical protein